MTYLLSIGSPLQTHYYFKLDFHEVDQHTEGKWLIHGTKRHKDNQLPVEYSSRDSKHEINESEGNMVNPIFTDNIKRQNIHRCA